jgi:7-dehydrocholesterol reductase
MQKAHALRTSVGPALLMIVCPLAMGAFAHCVRDLDGSLVSLAHAAREPDFLYRIFPRPTVRAIAFLGGLLLLQLTLLIAVPGETYNGPRAPSGHVPKYTANGCACFVCTLGVLGGCCWCGALRPTLIHDELLPIMSTLNAGALLASFGLYVKGLCSPSTADCGSSGGLLMDVYWGTELYPRVLGVDLKQLLICRFGIVLWCLFALSFAAASAERAGASMPPNDQLVSASLMSVYIGKFFWWERWYMHAADIQVDRLGFMMCWGPVCFMPLVHTLQNLYLVSHNGLGLSGPAAVAYLVAGNLMTYVNYEADTQRHRVRASGGKCLVWGRRATAIRATYTTNDGNVHTSLLSTCGYQRLSRHFHYLPDIVNLFLYCSPAGFAHVLPHLYFIYLTALLLDRTYRIDARCHAKYGRAWEAYVKQVPYRLIPGVW